MPQCSLRAGKENEPDIEYAAQADLALSERPRKSKEIEGNQKERKRSKRKKLGDAGNGKETSHRRAARRVVNQAGKVIHKQHTGMPPVSFVEHSRHPGESALVVHKKVLMLHIDLLMEHFGGVDVQARHADIFPLRP